MTTTSYVIALGSNRRGLHGGPRDELAAALCLLAPLAASPILTTDPVGPSKRRFANAAALIESEENPPELLKRLKRIEHSFGRRRGQNWSARVIDLDIVLWSGGIWGEPSLTVPHLLFRDRDFVMTPLMALVPDWRDPVSGLTMRQLNARLHRKIALPC